MNNFMKNRIGLKLVVVAGMFALGLLRAADTPSKALLALAKHDRTLAIVDPSTLKIIAKVPVGPDPHEVIADSEGKYAYASNYGGGTYRTLAVVDVAGQKALPSVDLGPLNGPHGLTFAGGKLWFTAEGAKVIGSYDPAAKKVDWVLGTGQNTTHMIYVFDDLKRIVTSNIRSATMSFIEQTGPRGDWDETVIGVRQGAEGFDVSPDGKQIWAANAGDGTISIIDVAGKKVTETLPAEVSGANRLKFTPDGKRVFVSSLRLPTVAVFDAASHQAVKRVQVGHGAAGILMDPDGSRVFVACSPDNYVVVIDLKLLEVTGHLEVGNDPDGLAWAIRR